MHEGKRGGGGQAQAGRDSGDESPHLNFFCANGPACYAACTGPSTLCLAG